MANAAEVFLRVEEARSFEITEPSLNDIFIEKVKNA